MERYLVITSKDQKHTSQSGQKILALIKLLLYMQSDTFPCIDMI